MAGSDKSTKASMSFPAKTPSKNDPLDKSSVPCAIICVPATWTKCSTNLCRILAFLSLSINTCSNFDDYPPLKKQLSAVELSLNS
jgi:hypothetical protein